MTALDQAEPSPFLTVAQAARFAGMSPSNIRRRAPEGFGFKPGGKGDWIIRRDLFERWLNGEVLK